MFGGTKTGRSDSDVLMAIVQDLEPGDIITYASIQEILEGENPGRTVTMATVQGAARRANKRLLRNNKRCLWNVPQVGYKIASAAQQLDISQHYQAKSRRSMSRAHDTAELVRVEELSEELRRFRDSQLIALNATLGMINGLQKRQTRVEKALDNLRSRVEHLEA